MVDQPSTATTPHSNLDTKTRLKSILGGSAGNLVEWYDWYVYAAFTLYFAHAFFQKVARQLNSFKRLQFLL